MGVRALFFLIVWFGFGPVFLHSAEWPLVLDRHQAHELETAELAGGGLAITTTGADPYILTAPLPAEINPQETFVLAFEYFCPDGIDGLQIFYGPPFGESHSFQAGKLGRAEVWQPVVLDLKRAAASWNGQSQFRIDLGSKSGIHLQLRNLKLRAPSPAEVAAQSHLEEEARKKRLLSEAATRYWATEFPSRIEAVTVSRERVEIRGEAVGSAQEKPFLAEIGIYEEPWALTQFVPLQELTTSRFALEVPRFHGQQDRLFSRWCLLWRQNDGSFRLGSHAVYATDLSALCPPAQKREARTKKGMGGVSASAIAPELVEMGMEHVTVNIVLNSLLRVRPGKESTPFEFEGQTYAIASAAIRSLDQTLEFYSQNRMSVSAIVLVSFPADPEERALMVHPEAVTPGIYAMPNLTTDEGARTYRAALAFLAQRYAGAEHGLIAHWILHNEVDYAWTWTNMGSQPMNLFMASYLRSMRCAYLTARQFNANADVYISLTHNWTTPEGSEGKNYRTRDMLELLALATQREGDFEWGVAYHPYPQSLFKPATWNDTKALFSFDTPLITPKNIEVLDAYLHQKRFLYQGRELRKVMLSEQGFHTPDYSEPSQALQAAALVYTWHKIRPLESIVCFQNHRWIDAAAEGGLLVGLRTVPAPGKPFGEKKLAWSVYQALDTPAEAEVTAFAKAIIGIKDFAEIPYRGEIK